MQQTTIARGHCSDKTAYSPVTNAIPIAISASHNSAREYPRKLFIISSSVWNGMMIRISAAIMDEVIAIVSVMMKVLKATFLPNTTMPLCGSSAWKPPGMVNAAANVTVAIRVAIKIRAPAISLRVLKPLICLEARFFLSRISFGFLALFA